MILVMAGGRMGMGLLFFRVKDFGAMVCGENAGCEGNALGCCFRKSETKEGQPSVLQERTIILDHGFR